MIERTKARAMNKKVALILAAIAGFVGWAIVSNVLLGCG